MTPRQLEYVKCWKDKTRKYFIENYLSTFDAVERKETAFKLFPRQVEFINSLVEYQNTIAIKHRQAGITTVSSAWITGQIVFADKSSPETVLCIGNKLDISQQLIDKIGKFLDQVPRWMWGDDYYSPDPDSDKNKKSIYKARNKQYIELFNGCKVHARSSGENAARGISAVSILIFDEAAFIQNGTTVYAQAVAATASVQNAKIIMVSTPNGKDQLYYKTYINALDKKNNYHPVEFKWFQDPRYNKHLKWHKKNNETGEDEVIAETVINKKGDINYNEDKWRKLERDGWVPISPWYSEMCKTFNNDTQKVAQELDVSFMGSSDNVVPVEVIETHRKENVIELGDDWKLWDVLVNETWIWKDPIPNHRYICACLPEHEYVTTNYGTKPIGKVTLKDKLYDKDGNLTNIKRIINREYNGDIYKFKLKNILDEKAFTSNHPIWSSINTRIVRNVKRRRIFDFRYNNAEKLNVGDWLEFPNIYHYNTLSENELKHKWDKYEKTGRYDFSIETPLLDEEFWYYCGMWIAEGWINHTKNNNITISTIHNIKETSIHERIVKLVKRLFKRSINNRPNMKNNSSTLIFSSKQVGYFLEENFGRYAQNKFISEWIKFIPAKFKLRLIEGYWFGDGCINKDGSADYVSVSKKLLCDIQDILFSLGVVSSLKKHNDACDGVINGKNVKCKAKYMLHIGNYDSKYLLDSMNVKNNIIIKESRRRISSCYLSDEYDKIYLQISKITVQKYHGTVCNFETEAHSFCCPYVATHNCDPSSGSGNDSTAIEIIDVDAVDEGGLPLFEQVLEYNGKLNGSEVGQLVDRYGRIYNNALAVVECIGGYGDPVILTLMDLNYPNLYYDNPKLKNYTSQTTKYLSYKEQQEQLPGFRTSALRLQMIANFVDMLKTNAFKIRSVRVVNQLETWVFKSGRPDHMDGCHDDLLTCLAMGLFVLQFYMIVSDKKKKMDAVIVSSWAVNNLNSINNIKKRTINNVDISNVNNKYKMPFYSSNNLTQDAKARMNGMLMLAGFSPYKHSSKS